MTDIHEILRSNPLLGFSVYTHSQASYLVKLGTTLQSEFDTFESVIEDFDDTYHQFWLWVLGAYEVVRTLDQHSSQFEPEFAHQVGELKRFLAHIRVPFAKQEHRGKGSAIAGDLSVKGFGKDMKFEIDGVDVSARSVIERFNEFVESIEFQSLFPSDA